MKATKPEKEARRIIVTSVEEFQLVSRLTTFEDLRRQSGRRSFPIWVVIWLALIALLNSLLCEDTAPSKTDLCVMSKGYLVTGVAQVGIGLLLSRTVPLHVIAGEWVLLAHEAWVWGLFPLPSLCAKGILEIRVLVMVAVYLATITLAPFWLVPVPSCTKILFQTLQRIMLALIIINYFLDSNARKVYNVSVSYYAFCLVVIFEVILCFKSRELRRCFPHIYGSHAGPAAPSYLLSPRGNELDSFPRHMNSYYRREEIQRFIKMSPYWCVVTYVPGIVGAMVCGILLHTTSWFYHSAELGTILLEESKKGAESCHSFEALLNINFGLSAPATAKMAVETGGHGLSEHQREEVWLWSNRHFQ
ncbi:hypothetical protein CYMTET_15109 [Cymbomonas tetramitiformis]|uniref:Uncharacterized protein n=1 Tax=Cymbomonas tetramitiformis TaxID=36881 RepID=A0AAE0GEX0_9CHLO|nr:hypothetical protein CYMTET_15109 [Cymbomonas tetramitiformis]